MSVGQLVAFQAPHAAVVGERGGAQRAEDDVGQVVGASAQAALAQQHPDVGPVEGVRGARQVRLVGALGGHQQLGVALEEVQVRAPERAQALERRSARAEWGLAADHRVLQLRLVFGEDCAGEARAVAEAPEERALADAGLGRDGIHRHVRGAAAREQLLRRRKHLAAVLGGVRALGARFAEEREGAGHRGCIIAELDRSPVTCYIVSSKRTTVRITSQQESLR